MEDSVEIDYNLIDQIVLNIPTHTWDIVRTAIVTNIVDNIPSDVMVKLTKTCDDFDKAESILFAYYELPAMQRDLIIDAFKILGAETVVYLLDSLQLTKVAVPTDQ